MRISYMLFHYTACIIAFVGGVVAQLSNGNVSQGVGAVASICALLSLLIPAWLNDRKNSRENDIRLFNLLTENTNIRKEAAEAKEKATNLEVQNQKLSQRVDRLDVKNVQMDTNTERIGITETKVDVSTTALIAAGYLKSSETQPLIRLSRLLIIEDDTDIAKALVKLLSKKGFVVDYANSLSVANNIIDNSELFDWIILDLNLGIEQGEGIVKMIEEKKLPTKIVVTTGLSDEFRLNKIRNLGLKTILIKPIDLEELTNILKGQL